MGIDGKLARKRLLRAIALAVSSSAQATEGATETAEAETAEESSVSSSSAAAANVAQGGAAGGACEDDDDLAEQMASQCVIAAAQNEHGGEYEYDGEGGEEALAELSGDVDAVSADGSLDGSLGGGGDGGSECPSMGDVSLGETSLGGDEGQNEEEDGEEEGEESDQAQSSSSEEEEEDDVEWSKQQNMGEKAQSTNTRRSSRRQCMRPLQWWKLETCAYVGTTNDEPTQWSCAVPLVVLLRLLFVVVCGEVIEDTH